MALIASFFRHQGTGLPWLFFPRRPPLGSNRHRRRTQSGNPRQDLTEHPARHRDFGHLEGDIAAVADHLCADLDQLLPQRRQRPVRNRSWQGQGPHEVGEVVGERVKPKPNLVVTELLAREARLFDRVFAFLDPLLRRTAPIGERHHLLVGTV